MADMKLLAIDTATEACSAALAIGATVLARYEEPGRAHAERILPMVDELLKEAGVSLSELDAIAFGRGPGAFTGLRIAAGVAQGLAYGAGLPVVPVSNLVALAERALMERGGAAVLACMDARMSEVYWCAFQRVAPEGTEALGPERVTPPDAVTLEESPLRNRLGIQSWIAAGTGLGAYPALAVRLGLAAGNVAGNLLPRAHEIVRIAMRELKAGRALPADEALPVYLRDQVAVVPRH
jgi:tRNA threonylcarbamoyladenosine biosynthesis protein TsaB